MYTQLLWGPLCLYMAYLTTFNHSLKHPLRIIICMAHLYGDTLYYATSLYDHYVNGIPHSRPEVLYFWVYYFLMNFVWIVVPACESIMLNWTINILTMLADLLYNSVSLISQAMTRFDEEARAKKIQ